MERRKSRKISRSCSSKCLDLFMIEVPHENDVLFGRGGGTNHHPGNKRYRKMVEDRKIEYLNCKRLEKPLVALNIVRKIRSLDPPGRFLSIHNKSGLWFDVGDKKARVKTSQALRENAPRIREQHLEIGHKNELFDDYSPTYRNNDMAQDSVDESRTFQEMQKNLKKQYDRSLQDIDLIESIPPIVKKYTSIMELNEQNEDSENDPISFMEEYPTIEYSSFCDATFEPSTTVSELFRENSIGTFVTRSVDSNATISFLHESCESLQPVTSESLKTSTTATKNHAQSFSRLDDSRYIDCNIQPCKRSNVSWSMRDHSLSRNPLPFTSLCQPANPASFVNQILPQSSSNNIVSHDNLTLKTGNGTPESSKVDLEYSCNWYNKTPSVSTSIDSCSNLDESSLLFDFGDLKKATMQYVELIKTEIKSGEPEIFFKCCQESLDPHAFPLSDVKCNSSAMPDKSCMDCYEPASTTVDSDKKKDFETKSDLHTSSGMYVPLNSDRGSESKNSNKSIVIVPCDIENTVNQLGESFEQSYIGTP